jgi:hypothetical protein
MAAARVKSDTGTKVLDLADQMRVRRTAGQLIWVLAQNLRPTLFPITLVVRRIGHGAAHER